MRHGNWNTKFFRQTILYRRRRNKIVRIKDEVGEWVEGDTRVRDEIYKFYIGLFKRQEEVQGR